MILEKPEVQEILLKHAQTIEEAKRKEKERKKEGKKKRKERKKDLLIISSIVLTKSNSGISFGKWKPRNIFLFSFDTCTHVRKS